MIRSHEIKLNNFYDNETVCYSLILLKGSIGNIESCNETIEELKIYNGPEDLLLKTVDIFKNNFKCLVPLLNGANTIKIHYCCAELKIIIHYIPRITNALVVPLYIVCKNDDGRFQADESTNDNSVESALLRISTGIKLIQCLFAEKFHENGLERKTFQLECDCRVFQSDLCVERAREMKQDELWNFFGREIMESELGDANRKYVAFISCTRYRVDKYDENVRTFDDIVGITEAHAALGGGGLAIFGTGCIHTWPESSDEVMKCFLDKTPIDRRSLMDDSNYRSTRGGCFASTLGAVCHELGHTFDLGHTSEGIMGRDFFRIDKTFTVDRRNQVQHCTVSFNPSSSTRQRSKIDVVVKQRTSKNQVVKEDIYWSVNNLKQLYYHKWFNSFNSVNTIHISDDRKVTSDNDIFFVELRNKSSGLTIKWWDFSEDPVTEFALPQVENVSCIVEDRYGNTLKKDL